MDEVKNGQFIHETSVDAEVVDALREMLSENSEYAGKWDERPMLVIDGKKYMDPYKPESTLPHGIPCRDFDGRAGIQYRTEGMQFFSNPNEPMSITHISFAAPYRTRRSGFRKQKLAVPSLDQRRCRCVKERKLTLDDVRWLAQKGGALSWDDFDAYQGTDVGSGLYIMQYVIDDLFDVLVGGGSMEADPEYVHLRNRDINAWVDIRTDDIDEFIETYAVSR